MFFTQRLCISIHTQFFWHPFICNLHNLISAMKTPRLEGMKKCLHVRENTWTSENSVLKTKIRSYPKICVLCTKSKTYWPAFGRMTANANALRYFHALWLASRLKFPGKHSNATLCCQLKLKFIFLIFTSEIKFVLAYCRLSISEITEDVICFHISYRYRCQTWANKLIY